jgi:hypothetical protein
MTMQSNLALILFGIILIGCQKESRQVNLQQPQCDVKTNPDCNKKTSGTGGGETSGGDDGDGGGDGGAPHDGSPAPNQDSSNPPVDPNAKPPEQSTPAPVDPNANPNNGGTPNNNVNPNNVNPNNVNPNNVNPNSGDGIDVPSTPEDILNGGGGGPSDHFAVPQDVASFGFVAEISPAGKPILSMSKTDALAKMKDIKAGATYILSAGDASKKILGKIAQFDMRVEFEIEGKKCRGRGVGATAVGTKVPIGTECAPLPGAQPSPQQSQQQNGKK